MQTTVNQTAATKATPWQEIPGSIALLRRQGGPPSLGLRIAELFAELGLQEPAAAWASAIAKPITESGDPALAQRLVALAGLIGELSPSAVDTAELIATCEANLDAREDLREQLAAALPAWRQRAAGLACFRANDGNLIALSTRCDLSDPGWLMRFGDRRGGAASMPIWPNERKSSGVPAPVLVHGFDNAWALAKLHDHFAPLDFGSRAAIWLVESDATTALDALATTDLRTALAEDRLCVFVGEGAEDRLLDTLAADLGGWSSPGYIALRDVGGSELKNRVQALIDRQGAECVEAIRSVKARYAGRDSTYWTQRFAAAGDNEPLRVLILSTRFGTYIKHAAADIAAAFADRGADARLLLEPNDWTETNGLRIAGEIESFKPDALVMINYTRAHNSELIPAGLPVITWVQDAMPHLFSEETASSVADIDLVVGNIFGELTAYHGYPADRCLRFGVPASVAKFSRRARAGRFEYDVIAATNHSESPAVMSERMEREARASGAPAGLAGEVCERVTEAVGAWDWGWLEWTLEDAVGEAFMARDLSPESPAAAKMRREIAFPLANRVLRYRVLRWAAELADEQGLRFALFGSGWESDPEFAPFARGVLDHGDELAQAYASSAVTLHAGAHWVMHQRLYECAMAGGLPVTLLRPEDAAHALRPARQHLRETGATPTACRLSDRAECITAIESPLAAASLSLAQRLALSTDIERDGRHFDVAASLANGLMPIGTMKTNNHPIVPELETKAEQLRLIDLLSGTMFSSKAELSGLVEQAKIDIAWRRSQSEAVARIAERSFSYEAAVSGIVGALQRSKPSNTSASRAG